MKKHNKLTVLMCVSCLLFQSLLPISAAGGIEVFKPEYDYIRPFTDDFASAYRNGEYSIIRKDNAVFYTSDADGFGNYREGFISFYDNDTTKIARLNGDTLSLPGMQYAGDYRGAKCAVVDAQRKYGMIDTQGNVLLECLFEDILYNESDTVCVKENGVWRTITLNPFSRAARTSYRLVDPYYSATGGHIIASNGNGYGILSTEQVPLTEFKYDLIRDASGGIFVAYYGDFVDLIRVDGSIAATVKADFVGAYASGVLPCHGENGFRYIDINGNTVMLPQIAGLTYADSFYDGYAVVRNSTGYTFMNATGMQATRTFWDFADRFANGFALVMNYHLDEDTKIMEQQWYIINSAFQVVEVLDEDIYYDVADAASTNFSQGYVRTIDRNTNLMGFIRLGTDSDTPQNVPVIGVSVTPAEKMLTTIGESFTLSAAVLPQNATNKKVAFSSSNPSVAIVDSATGKVTAQGSGTATIWATTADGGKAAGCQVTVNIHTHVMTAVPSNPATCIATGILAHWHCALCDKNFSDQEGKVVLKNVTAPIDRNNHVGETEIRNQVDATSKHEGYTGDVYCLSCGNMITVGTSIEKLPSNPSDYWLEVLMYLYNQKFAVTATAGAGGTITPEGTSIVSYNRSITYTVTPHEGYAIENVYINGEAIGAVSEYTFKKVQSEQKITATFIKKAWVNPFTDVDIGMEYYADIQFVCENGFMSGTSDTHFSPESAINRADLVMILWRMDGCPVVNSSADFFDVPEYSEYAHAVNWASTNGIVTGYGNSLFGPFNEVTNEQLITILWRYAKYKGISVYITQDEKVLYVIDTDGVSGYAHSAYQWAYDTEIIVNSLNDRSHYPQDKATRAWFAHILNNFLINNDRAL